MREEDDTWLDVLEYDFEQADLFTLDVDAVAIPVNITLNLHYTLGQALVLRGGPVVEERVLKAARALKSGRLTLGTATSIDTRDVEHLPSRVILTAWWDEKTNFGNRHIESCYASALREAFKFQMSSLALPILGGAAKVPKVTPERRATVICDMLRALDGLKKSGAFSVERLVFADLASEPLDAIELELNRRLYSP